MIGRFLEYMPDVKQCLSSMEERPSTYIRTNTIKIDSKSLSCLLEEKGIEIEPTELSEVHRVVQSDLPIGATSEYLAGYTTFKT